MPLLYSIYTGRQAGASAGAALGAKAKVMELSSVASDSDGGIVSVYNSGNDGALRFR